MKVLAINGSPRKGGNTARLLQLMTDGQKGADLEYVDLIDLRIGDCIECMHCKENGSCSIDDDMTRLYDSLQRCAALVLASPLFGGGETATMKAFVDRTYALLSFAKGPGMFTPRLKGGKKAIAFFTCGHPDGARSYAYMNDRYYSLFGLLGFRQAHCYIIGGVSPAHDVMDNLKAQTMVDECRMILGI